ncbi:uncharacterized protein LOC109541484 isoform X2 [Dendroctonus ponderosae]|uniref:uncharacterized protein LOC109541484 isoform X2 n=1 Tax=Dendroctonus ponderosae TaxID=77166 RepID=UPI002035DCBA|nr:uncharacterized protein LOC109541484 isoform X2 [Dendroctonus ponderosae]
MHVFNYSAIYCVVIGQLFARRPLWPIDVLSARKKPSSSFSLTSLLLTICYEFIQRTKLLIIALFKMGRRYYCEYCDKTFIDELEARRKHLQSAHHIKLRNMHYEHCRDPATILKEELLKTPCRKYFQNGTCMFEGSCKYTHYSPEQLCVLRQQAQFNQNMPIDSSISAKQQTCDLKIYQNLFIPVLNFVIKTV